MHAIIQAVLLSGFFLGLSLSVKAQEIYQGLSPVVQAPGSLGAGVGQVVDGGEPWGQPLEDSAGAQGLNEAQSGSVLAEMRVATHWRYDNPAGSSLRGANGMGVSLLLPLRADVFAESGFDWSRGTNAAAPPSQDYNLRHFRVGLGIGWAVGTQSRLEASTGVSYAQLDTSRPADGFDEAALYFRLGMTTQVTSRLGLGAGGRITTHDRYQFLSVDLEANYQLLRQFDVSLGTEYGDFSRSFRAGARLRW